MRSTVICASAGNWLRASFTLVLTSCWATTISTPHEKSTETSVAPRSVVDRTRCTPGTVVIASSRGRVTPISIMAAGRSPASTITTTLGKVTSGRMDTGNDPTIQAPTAHSTRVTKSSALRLPVANRLRLNVAFSFHRSRFYHWAGC